MIWHAARVAAIFVLSCLQSFAGPPVSEPPLRRPVGDETPSGSADGALESLVRGDPCLQVGCGIESSAECKWTAFDASCAAPHLLSKVDQRLCEFGIRMDGSILDSFGPDGWGPNNCEAPPCARLPIGCDPDQGCGACCNPELFQCPLSMFKSQRGVALIDQMANTSAPTECPAETGDNESPLFPENPSGFNLKAAVVWFVPDDDPGDHVDSSFLYLAWDVTDRVSVFSEEERIPFDADVNASACLSDDVELAADDDQEYYSGYLRSCASLAQFDPQGRDPGLTRTEPDVVVQLFNDYFFDEANQFRARERGGFRPALDVVSFPTADNVTHPTNGCLQRELELCRKKCSGNGAACEDDGDCPGGQTCVLPSNANNVELVIKRVESSGVFGPFLAKRCQAVANVPPAKVGESCRTATDCDCPANDLTCCTLPAGAPNPPIAPDSPEAVANRFALFRLMVVLGADTDAELSPEEAANVAQIQSAPNLEVTKLVRCAEEGSTTFHEGPADALPGSLVQYEIKIENKGNEDVDVHVQDVLKSVGGALPDSCEVYCGNICAYPDPNCAGGNCPDLPCPAGTDAANCLERACETNTDCDAGGTCTGSPLTARLSSWRRAPAGSNSPFTTLVTFGNANQEPICRPNILDGCLSQEFFIGSCNVPGETTSFLESIVNGTDVRMGTLLGGLVYRQTCADGNTPCDSDADCPGGESRSCRSGQDFTSRICSFALGDVITLRFFVRAGQAPGEPYCSPRAPVDCENTVTVTASAPGPDDDVRLQVCADTGLVCDDVQFPCLGNAPCDLLERSGEADIDILCRDIEFTKWIGCEGIEETFVAFPDHLLIPGDCAGLSCCSPHPSTPGCADATCQANVCAQRASCCEDGWDDACAAIARATCDICRNPNTCCASDERPGCNDNACEAAVCATLPDCCAEAWSAACVAAAEAECTGCGNSGSCCEAAVAPGCGDDTCETAVCSLIPSCCTDAWDATCAAQAGKSCVECSDAFCCVAHDTPDCPSDACSDRVCAFYAQCCADEWNDDCAKAALDGCETCGGNYSCCEPRGFIPGCEDATCQAVVCADDPFCCGEFGGVWDVNCVDLATILCQTCDLAGVDRSARTVAGGSNGAGGDEKNQATPAQPARTRDPAERLAIARAGSDAPARLAVSRIETSVAGITFDPVTIEYRYRVVNTGETPETLSICDREFCCDVDAIARQLPGQIELLGCDVCRACDACAECEDCDPSQGPCPDCEVCSRCVSSSQPVSPVGRCRANPTIVCAVDAECPAGDSCSDGALAASCAIRFHTEEAMRAFTLRDDTDGACLPDVAPIPDSADENCYRNCATATADIADDDPRLGDICRPPTPEISVNALAEYCIRVCEVRVFKQVRCLPDCDPAALGAEDGWNNRCVANPAIPCEANADCPLGDTCDTAAEPALPGACLQYRIIIDNPPTEPGAEPAPICAINLIDTMLQKDTFSAGPYDVRVIGAPCDNLPNEFNWIGEPVCCSFASDSFAPGERVVITFRADVALNASPAAAPVNQVDVEGANDGQCAETCAQSRFSCDDFADVPVDVRDCAFTLEKEVRCDTADGSGTYAEKEEALPGSTAEFKFEICNTGDVDLTSVALDDEMMASCEGWFIPGSVVCAIAGQPATSCVCLDGRCDTADEIDGVKDLTDCRAGGIRATVAPPAPDECLVCTFKVRVPEDYAEKGTDCLLPDGSDCDCVNTITAEPTSDVCHDERDGAVNPCDRLVDDAWLDVRVPQIECDKESCVDLDRNGTCDITADAGDPESPLCVPAADAAYPLRVIWTFEAIAPEPGEVPFAVARVCDKDFRDHAALNAAAGVPVNERVIVMSCDLDAVTGCATVGRLEPGQTKLARCTLEFPSEAAWRRFAAKENSLDKFCYTNEARASGDIDTAGLCFLGADLTKESDACVHDTCIEPLCEIDVVKQARCLPDCSASGLGPNDGWRNACRNNTAVPCDKNADCPAGDTCNTDALPVPAGSCVQYRIVFKNKSADVPLRGIRVTDTMFNKDRFKADPLTSTTTCPCTFVPAFNIDGIPSVCQFTEQTELQPGASCSVTFTREAREAGDPLMVSAPDPVNQVLAEGAPGLERCDISPKSWECEENSQVTVDVQRCDFTVTKDAKCEEEPDASFRDKADALPGSRVDFRIRVCNTGDITLSSLTLNDAFADSARCDWYVAESLTAFIGQNNVTGAVCNSSVSETQCQTLAEMNGLKTFASGVAQGACLEIRFKVRVPVDFDAADDAATNCSGNGCPTGCDCCNNITVSTTPGFCPDGRQGQTPPCPTRTDCACVDVKVPDIECDKESCVDQDADGDCDITVPAGTNPDLCVPAANVEYPFEIIWFFRARNTGEVPYAQTRVCDPDFVADLNANANNPDIELMGCDLSLTTGCAELGALPANPALLPEAKCVVRFLSEAGWRDFAAKDSDGDEFCYTNEAEAVGTVNTAGLCTTGADLTIESEPCEHVTCIEPLCEIDVVKQARCLPNCVATGLGANEGWRNACVNNPATPCESNSDCPPGDTCNLGPLPAAAGACVQFRIVIKNPSADVPIRALAITDTLNGGDQFKPGPISPIITCPCNPNIPFNDTGLRMVCQPTSGDVLPPGGSCTISYIRELRERTDPLLNFGISPNDGVVVEGAPGLDVCPVSPKSFKCEDPGSVGVDIQSCQFTVTKDAKCEEDPDAAFANQVEALPGSRVDFRIRVCNQGDLPLTSVNLSDELTCQTWFIPESVTATINGAPVTSAICDNNASGAPNQCQTLGEMNGNKTLPGAGVPSGQCLEIRFKVRVPVDFAQKGTDCLLPDGSDCDCVNTITVRPGTSICTDLRTGQLAPCDQLNDSARIDVRVPQIECDKSSCIDTSLPPDGVCEIPVSGDPATVCATSGEIAYPFNLRLTLEASNPPASEVDYSTVRVCDPDLRNDLPPVNPIPGVTVNGCVFDANGCIALAPLVPGGTASVTCVITFLNEDAWRAFAAKDADGEPFCYENTARAIGDIDADDLCTNGATLTRTSEPCEHTTCVEPKCDIGVVKQARCLPNCTEAGLGANEGWKSNVCSGNRARTCESDANCTGAGNCVSDLDVTAGACVQYRIVVTNESDDVPIRALRFTDLMTNRDTFKPTALSATNTCFCTFDVPFNIDGNPSICQLPPGNRLDPGESCEVKFIREVRERSDAQLNYTLDPSNAITVEGAAGHQECPISPKAFTCNDPSAVAIDVRRCDFTVDKQVKCAEEPDGAYADIGYALPGSCNDFRIRIRNTGEVPLDEITITDVLSCDPWYVSESLTARLNGAGQDLTAVFCASNSPGTTPGKCQAAHEMNGRKALVPALPNGLPTGDFIDIVFRVCVPLNFSATGTAVDCTNTVEVGAETTVCEDERTTAESACGTREDSARIDVRVPKVECDKEACFDFNADGSCEIDFAPAIEVDECVFPMDVIWRFRARNIGETGLTNVTLTDAEFWNDAENNPGIAISCDAGAPGPGGVFTIPSLAAGAESAYITCTLSFPDEAVWRAFSDGDGESNGVQDCRNNTITVTGDPSGEGLVDGSGAPIDLCDSAILATSTCQASACCGACEIVDECPPVVKAVFEVFNENESKLSGLERCVQSWDSRFFSKYAEGLFVPNYFYMWLLGTDKGMARIDGIASAQVCGSESVAAPLIGVAAKRIAFGTGPNAPASRAGLTLVGTGYQPGAVYYPVRSGGGDDNDTAGSDDRGGTRPDGRPSGPTQKVPNPGDGGGDGDDGDPVPERGSGGDPPRATISEKGSFLVFPKVEVKYDRAGRLAADTFISIYNDSEAPVYVQTYLVSSQLCVWADAAFNVTKTQPLYWSIESGQPIGANSLPLLGPGCTDPDPYNPGGRATYGYLLVWAIDPVTLSEIRWNHLTGDALIVNYDEGSAWEYNALAFAAVAGATNGSPLLAPFGQLDFNGAEYRSAPDKLLLDFYASGSTLGTGPEINLSLDTELTLWALLKDLRANTNPDGGSPAPQP